MLIPVYTAMHLALFIQLIYLMIRDKRFGANVRDKDGPGHLGT